MSNVRIVTILCAFVASAVLGHPVLAQDFVAPRAETTARVTAMPVGEHLEYDVRFG